MFKVLDVREHKYNVSHSCGNGNTYSSNTSIQGETHHEIVVICNELKTNRRRRFVITEGHKSKGYDGNYHYYGYQGDYELLIIGDIFDIEPTNTYNKVIIVENY